MKGTTPRNAKGRFTKATRRNPGFFVKNGVLHPIRGSKHYLAKKGKEEWHGPYDPHKAGEKTFAERHAKK